MKSIISIEYVSLLVQRSTISTGIDNWHLPRNMWGCTFGLLPIFLFELSVKQILLTSLKWRVEKKCYLHFSKNSQRLKSQKPKQFLGKVLRVLFCSTGSSVSRRIDFWSNRPTWHFWHRFSFADTKSRQFSKTDASL